MCCGRTWVTAGVEAAVEQLYQEEKEARRGEEGERESGLREERLGARSSNPIYSSSDHALAPSST